MTEDMFLDCLQKGVREIALQRGVDRAVTQAAVGVINRMTAYVKGKTRPPRRVGEPTDEEWRSYLLAIQSDPPWRVGEPTPAEIAKYNLEP